MKPYSQQIMCIVFSMVSLVISQFSTIPQFIELKKTRNSSGVSLLTYIIFVCTSFFWSAWSLMFYYGQMVKGPADVSVPIWMHQFGMIPTIIMNNANLLIMTTVLIIKLRHLSLCKKYGVNELELSHILLSQDMKKCQKFGKGKKVVRFLPQAIILFAFVVILTLSTFAILKFWKIEKGDLAKWFSVLTLVFNAIGAITWEAVSWPQFIKSMKEKDTTGISLAWAIFLPVSCTILFFSDLLQGLAGGTEAGGINIGKLDAGIFFSLVFNGMISGYAVLFLKIRNIKKAKKMNMSEEEYTRKVLIPLAKKQALEKAAKKASKAK